MKSNGKTFLRYLRDGLIIVSIGILLMIVSEIVVRFFYPQDLDVHEKDNLPLAMVDSVLGHVYRPNTAATVKWPEYAASYAINTDGMRDEAIHPSVKNDSTIRILLLGDSFAFGVGVDYDDTWGAIAERKWRENGINVEFIKAGVSGYDTRLELLYLRRLVPKYHPDIVLIAFLQNDLITNLPLAASDSLEGEHSMREDSLTVRGQGDKLSHFQLVTLAKRMLLANDFIYTRMYFTTNRSVYYSYPANETLNRQVEITKELLLRIKEYCDQNGAGLFILSIPQEIQVIMKARNYSVSGINIGFVDEVFFQFARDHKFVWIPAFDALAKKYRSDFDDIYFRLDGHINKRGTQVLGDFLYQSMAESLKAFSSHPVH
jgi:lysophospholipase L1-like esterase